MSRAVIGFTLFTAVLLLAGCGTSNKVDTVNQATAPKQSATSNQVPNLTTKAAAASTPAITKVLGSSTGEWKFAMPMTSSFAQAFARRLPCQFSIQRSRQHCAIWGLS